MTPAGRVASILLAAIGALASKDSRSLRSRDVEVRLINCSQFTTKLCYVFIGRIKIQNFSISVCPTATGSCLGLVGPNWV